MRHAIIHVIIDYRPVGTGIIEQPRNLRPYHRVHREERAKQHDVTGLDVGIDEVELVVRVVFIEDVLSIVVVVEKRQRHR